MTPSRPAQATLDDFELGEEVAWGSLATIIDVVYKKNQKHYALKVLNKAQLVKKKVIRSAMVEKDALIALGTQPDPHPGVIRLHHCFQDTANLYFTLDLATNGDLKALVQRLGSISLKCAKYYAAQLVDAVQYLHNAGVVHRDIKPENILLDSSMRTKLADFGCAYVGTDLDTPRTNTFVGTAAYVSPEILDKSEVNPKSPDLWAIGCTIFFFLFGASPFLAANDYLTMKKVRALDYTIPEACDNDVADLIKRLLLRDPLERLGVAPNSSPEELRQHPFFVGYPPTAGKGTSNGSATVIDWDGLWTTPAPEIEALKALRYHTIRLLFQDFLDSGVFWTLYVNFILTCIPMVDPDTVRAPFIPRPPKGSNLSSRTEHSWANGQDVPFAPCVSTPYGHVVM